MRRRWFAFCVVAATSLSGQVPVLPPSDSALATITARGRMLLAYDIAAWHGGDAVAALNPRPDEISASFARQVNGRWEVVYGRLNAASDTFFVTLRARQTNGDSQYVAERLSQPEPDVGVQREMARAFVTAQRDFGRANRPYNAYVIPAAAGGFWVYLLPAQTDPRSFPLGGDVRYRIVNGTTIVDRVRFHTAVLDRISPADTPPSRLVAMVHTHLDSFPSETDVFVVLRRNPHVPEIIATRNYNFQIDVTGGISWSLAATRSSQDDQRVWQAKIDSIGHVRRVLSPGYTGWRDSTTGWRVSLERTVDIVGADSGSYNGTWRTLMLPDGRVLVSRFRPAAIQLYDAEGHFIRQIGREGTGPEEFRSQPTLAMKGDTLLALDGIESRVLMFMLDGRFVRAFDIAFRGSPIPIAVDRRGLVRVQERYATFVDSLSRMQWVYYTTRGVAVDSIARPPLPAAKAWHVLQGTRQMSFQVPMTEDPASTFLPDGTLIYGTPANPMFTATHNGSDTTLLFGRSDVKPSPVTPAFADSTMQQLVQMQPLLESVARRSDIPANYPLWTSIAADDHGYLWVSVGTRGRTPVAWNIYARDGRYLGQLPSWFDRFDAASFAGDWMSYVGYDRDRRAVLRVYRMDRRGREW